MQGFVKDYSSHLAKLREALSDTVSEAWQTDAETQVINIDMQPVDTDHIAKMIHTDNQQLNKVVLVFSVLCSEMKNLGDLAERKFYGPLTMFGHGQNMNLHHDGKEASGNPNNGEGGGNSNNNKHSTNNNNYNIKSDESMEKSMGAFLPFLQDLSNFINRCYAVARNTVNQIACLYHERQKLYISTFSKVRLEHVFECLGELCRILVTLDSIILDNTYIFDAWNSYKRMIKYVRGDPAKYGIKSQQLRVFESLLLQLDSTILSAGIFEGLLSQTYGELGQSAASRALVSGNKVLAEQFSFTIKSYFRRIKAGIGENVETYSRQNIVDLFCLYALFRRLFRETMKPDSSLYKDLWALQKKVPIVLLFGRASWFVADFLVKHAPLNIKSLKPPGTAIVKTRKQFLEDHDAQFVTRTNELYMQACRWMVRIESEVVTNKANNISAVLNTHSKLLLNGVLLANQIRNLVTINIHLHLVLEMRFRASNIRSLAVCSELLQAIQFTYSRRMGMISQSISHMLGQTSFTLKRIFAPVKKKLEKQTGLNDAKLDVLAAIDLSLSLLNRTPTEDRQTVLAISLCVAQLKNVLSQKHIDEVRYQLWKLKMVSSWQAKVRAHCDCSYLYWITNLVPAFFQDIYTNPEEVHRLQYIISALHDSHRLLRQTPVFTANGRHSSNPKPHTNSNDSSNDGAEGKYTDDDSNSKKKNKKSAKRKNKSKSSDKQALAQARALTTTDQHTQALLYQAYKHEVYDHFRDTLLKPLQRAVETDLRLHIHSVVLKQESLRKQNTVKDLSKFLDLKPLVFFDQVVDLREKVTHYLDQTFYNLTTVALHDWRVYAEMRNLAHEKYKLDMTPIYLPGTSHYSDALDILEIMRNIHIFVARYNYNMNTQIFIERAFNQKHLNCINTQHIAQSIRTHGIGIMNTTVNFTYGFLKRKFFVCSEFLFDDNIKSKLIKDIKYWKAERDALKNVYPYHRAEKFIADLVSLAVSDDGSTHLDSFRNQITEIGNALGYVRMVRSGGMMYCSNAIKFVPNLDEIPAFADTVKDKDLSEDTEQAATILDGILTDLSENFAEGTQYFKVLVETCQTSFQVDKQQHLRNFYAIVPPLTLNFLEKIMTQKEKLHKKGVIRQETCFTDDGFALGLAYLLKLLNQNEAFESLHWFDSVNQYIQLKRKELAEQEAQRKKKAKARSGYGDDDDDVQYSQLTVKRLEAIQKELDMFFYSFTGAQIFFQEAELDREGDKVGEKEGADGGGPDGAPEAPARGSDSDSDTGSDSDSGGGSNSMYNSSDSSGHHAEGVPPPPSMVSIPAAPPMAPALPPIPQ